MQFDVARLDVVPYLPAAHDVQVTAPAVEYFPGAAEVTKCGRVVGVATGRTGTQGSGNSEHGAKAGDASK